MQNYQKDLDYELDLMYQPRPAAVAKEAVLILAELVADVVSGHMPADEIQRRKSLFCSLARELRDSPGGLEAFRWARCFHTAAIECEKPPASQMNLDDIQYAHRCRDVTLAIVRAECDFIEPYLAVELSQVQSLLEHHGML
jgi:hypothetical protein